MLVHKQAFIGERKESSVVVILLRGGADLARDEVVCLRAAEEEQARPAVSHVRMIFVVWALVFTSRLSSNKHK